MIAASLRLDGWVAWDVTIDFVLDGLRGRHISHVYAEHERMAQARGMGVLEEELIDCGLQTWECGCCLADERFEREPRVVAVRREP